MYLEDFISGLGFIMLSGMWFFIDKYWGWVRSKNPKYSVIVFETPVGKVVAFIMGVISLSIGIFYIARAFSM
ncbi:MAG: hypothetical protein Q7R56_02155 [Nanoarchaeota archaeon]|nr:hypothetical protein [Nanoarchaeota archaeon]